MASGVRRDVLFVALTRPQMFAGVTYNFFIINSIGLLELFLIFKSFWTVIIGILVHICGIMLSVHEPRIVDLWINRVRNCPRIKNYDLWRCNSYRP